LDIQSSDAVKTTLHDVVADSASMAFVNLNEVHFIDSAGLSALVSGLRRARENNKDIILFGLNKQAQMIFQLTMLDRIFTIHSSMESVLASLSS
jgi:anti-anti-sigma factor